MEQISADKPPRYRETRKLADKSEAHVSLRWAKLKDIPVIRGLLRRSWRSAIAPHLPPECQAVFESTDPAGKYAAAMWQEFRVAKLNGSIVGMCHVQNNLVAAIHIEPIYKRNGIGTKLLADGIAQIASRHREARLEVLAFNDGARRFYEAQGWSPSASFLSEEMGCKVKMIEMRIALPSTPLES